MRRLPGHRFMIRTAMRQSIRNGVSREQIGELYARIAADGPGLSTQPDEEAAVERFARQVVEGFRGSGGLAFDPATVILLIQLALLIYQVLKEMGYLSPRGGRLTWAQFEKMVG